MTYRVEVSRRAERDLRLIYRTINAAHSLDAAAWFNGLETIIASLDQLPHRGGVTSEARRLRELLYGKRPHAYRIIYAIDDRRQVVHVVHIRHGARDRFMREVGAQA